MSAEPTEEGRRPPDSDEGSELTHLDRRGQARMVAVGHKPMQQRRAVATATVRMARVTARAITEGEMPKGDVGAIARVAGIMGAKRTSDLIPLCHPLPLESVSVEVRTNADVGEVVIEATVETIARTGVEMEALTAVSVAALAVYDLVKGVDKSVTIDKVKLVEKTKGRTYPGT